MRVCRNWCYCSCHVAGYMRETESRYQILVDKYCSTISCYSVKWCACSLHRSNTTGNGVVFILFFYFLIFFFISDFKATHFVKENIHINNFKWSTFFSKQSNCRWSFTWIAVNSLFLGIKSSRLTTKGHISFSCFGNSTDGNFEPWEMIILSKLDKSSKEMLPLSSEAYIWIKLLVSLIYQVTHEFPMTFWQRTKGIWFL